MPPPSADERLRRLLALVPWVAAHDGPTVAEVCERFGMTEAELVEDLELLFLCGLHPYTPDMLIEADISGGRVWIRYAEYFARPLRLTPAEGLALVAAGRSLLAGPGAEPGGPLARGLDKLGRVLGIGGDEAVAVDPGSAPADVLAAVRAAVEEQRAVELDYYSFGRDEWSRRVVEPSSVFSAAGQWYVSAYCRSVGDERLFRVDRIRSATLLDERFDRASAAPELAVFTPRDDDPRVELELAPAARWVVEQYPVEDVKERRGGRLRVRLAVSEQAWLERLLLRLGQDAKVVRGDAALATAAADRVLARYRRTPAVASNPS